jgi:hypothetical protein
MHVPRDIAPGCDQATPGQFVRDRYAGWTFPRDAKVPVFAFNKWSAQCAYVNGSKPRISIYVLVELRELSESVRNAHGLTVSVRASARVDDEVASIRLGSRGEFSSAAKVIGALAGRASACGPPRSSV